MPALNKIITKTQLAIIIAWLSFTVAAFGYFVSDRLVDFDANAKLTLISHEKLASHIAKFTGEVTKQTIVHFSSKGCKCQQFSDKHIQAINKLAKINDFKVSNVNLNKDDVIPSTPSVALLDSKGDVIYFGPYGQGIACSQTSGYAQTMLNNYIKGFKANIIIEDAKGCYCDI